MNDPTIDPEVNEMEEREPGKRPLNVLMVAPTSFFSDYGGHIRILEESLALKSLGHQITIVTYHQGNDVSDLNIRRTRSLPWHADYEVGSSRHKLAFDVYLLAKTLKEGFRIRPDLVHGHMHEGALIGAALAKTLRVPLVFDFQGGLTGEMVDHGFLDTSGHLYPWMRRLERFIDHLPDAILTSSLRGKDILVEEFSVVPEKIHPLPDNVDTERFDPSRFSYEDKLAVKKQLGIPVDRPIVAYLGLLADYQGTPQLIEAAAHLSHNGANIHFLVMGYPRVDVYREMAHQAGINDSITFTGKVEYNLAPHYLCLGDLAVSTKMSTTEGSGKVLNYMAMAQPIAAFDTPVHREYLGDLGRYAPIRDSSALAQEIADLVANPDQGRILGKKLRERAVEQYSWERAGRSIIELYQSLTS
jgi:glycosyltransferase involved in cell wall biosynthesis